MHKIKILGLFIFVLSLILAFILNTVSQKNRRHLDSLSIINEQKSTTQEISKAVLFLSKNKGNSTKYLDDNVKNFLANMTHKKEDSYEHTRLVKLWHEFYVLVQEFKKKQQISTLYSSLTIDVLVNDIYRKNQKIIQAFNTFINKKHKQYEEKVKGYKNVAYGLFFVLLILIMYLFTQVREVITFIQKFRTTSKSIIQKSTIEDLKPMEIHKNDIVLEEATQNFNHLVRKIDISIIDAQESIEYTTVSLETIEKNIENFMSLLTQMQEEESDAFSQKEDAVIDSLETVMNLTDRLKDLKIDLDKLTSSNNNH